MNVQDFLFNIPLYCWTECKEEDFEILSTDGDINTASRFDGYNPISCCESTYRLNSGFRPSPLLGDNSVLHDEFVLLQLSCTRKGDQMIILAEVDYDNMRIRKVGQYPSVADIHIAQIKHYTKVIPKADMRDMTRAIGLAANGIGIGSFVYLRRIFENLILEASQNSISQGKVLKEDFEQARMDEKITMIKDELPEFLYINKQIYGIISKGIHQLTEEECLAMFDVMRTSIEMILDEKLEKYKKEQKKKELQSSISKYASELSKK